MLDAESQPQRVESERALMSMPPKPQSLSLRVFLWAVTALCFGSLASTLPGCNQSPHFQTAQREDGRFDVEFPERPRDSVVNANSAYGPLDVNITTAEFSKMNFTVIYTDYPQEALTNNAEVFDHALIGIAENLHGKVLRHYTESKKALPGRGYEIAFGRDRLALGTLYLDGPRLFHVQVALPKTEQKNPLVQRFFKSFHVHHQEQPQDAPSKQPSVSP